MTEIKWTTRMLVAHFLHLYVNDLARLTRSPHLWRLNDWLGRQWIHPYIRQVARQRQLRKDSARG